MLVVARGAFHDRCSAEIHPQPVHRLPAAGDARPAFGKAIKANLFNPMPSRRRCIRGAFVILWAEKREHHPRVADSRRNDAGRCAQDGHCTGRRDDSRASRAPGRPSSAACSSVCRARRPPSSPSSSPFRRWSRRRSISSYKKRAAAQLPTISACGSSASSPPSFPPFLCRALAAALHFEPRLHALRLVSHLFRHRRVVDRTIRLGRSGPPTDSSTCTASVRRRRR